jgi:hypothetical protein
MSIDELLDQIEKNAGLLNTELYAADSLLKRVQEKLVNINLGIQFFIDTPTRVGCSGKYKEVKSIGFSEVECEWCLAIMHVSTYEGRPDMIKVFPLMSFDREFRILAAKQIPELLHVALDHISRRLLIVGMKE